MPGRGAGELDAALAGVEDEVRTWAARAQAALADAHLPGAVRSFVQLHALLVPRIDRWLQDRLGDEAGGSTPLSSAAGLPGLWQDLPDVDGEHTSLGELLVWHAADAEALLGAEALAAAPLDLLVEVSPDDAQLAAQRAWLETQLLSGPLPRSRWWRRLIGPGPRTEGLGDRARIAVQRGTQTVIERLPQTDGGEAPALEGASPRLDELSAWVGALRDGDRLTLQWHVPQPGRVAVLHAHGDTESAELEVLWPQIESESGSRRQGELVEVVGELSTDGDRERALVVVWVPSVLPPRWESDVVARRRLPPGARAFRYLFTVEPAP